MSKIISVSPEEVKVEGSKVTISDTEFAGIAKSSKSKAVDAIEGAGLGSVAEGSITIDGSGNVVISDSAFATAVQDRLDNTVSIMISNTVCINIICFEF